MADASSIVVGNPPDGSLGQEVLIPFTLLPLSRSVVILMRLVASSGRLLA